MKKFVIAFVIILISMLGIMTGVDYMISSGLRKTTIRKYAVWNDIYNGNINSVTNLVVLGASCSWCEYNPIIIDSICHSQSYVLGTDGHTFPMYKTRYDMYRKWYDTKNIIINIDMGTLGEDVYGYEREQFFPYFWLDKDLINKVKDTKDFTIFDRYIPLCRYWGYRNEIENGFKSICGQTRFEDDGVIRGYRGNEYAWSRRSLDLDTLLTIARDEKTLIMFVNFIRNEKAEGKNVILVMNPVYEELFGRMINLESMNALYDSISITENVPLLDYRHIWFNTDTSYFYNPSHLNKRGATLFSERLARDLDSMGILK